MPTVSIIIPVYNVEPYIERCIQSVLSQTYTDIECLLVDDCGTDNSMLLAEKKLCNYDGPINFKFLHHTRNRGLSAARNTGTEAATGVWIFYLDSDDAISNDAIELMIQESQSFPNVDIVVGNVLSDHNEDFYSLHFPEYPYILQGNRTIRKNFFNPKYTIPVMAWNKMLKRSFINVNKIIFKEGLIHEDELWIYHVIKQANLMVFINNYTYYHYCTQGSIMMTTSDSKRMSQWIIILDEMLNCIDNPFPKLQIVFILNKYLSFFNGLKQQPSFRKLTFKLIYKLLLQQYFRLCILTVLSQFSNRIYQKATYSIVPNYFKKLSINNAQ